MAHEGPSPATVPEDLSHWVQDEKFESLGVPVSVHTSTLTGLRVCVVRRRGGIARDWWRCSAGVPREATSTVCGRDM